MRLVTFKKGTSEKVGIHTGALGTGKIIDIEAAAAALPAEFGSWKCPVDMIDLIRNEGTALPMLKKLESMAPASSILSEESPTSLSPIPRPASMLDGYAFRQHC